MHRNRLRCAGAIVLATMGWMYAGAAASSLQYNSLALSGAVGTSLGLGPNLGPGVNFSGFGPPVLNAAGEVAFDGILSGAGVDSSNNSGVFSNAGGSLAVVARTGAAGPGPNLGPGVNFSRFGVPVLNAVGEVAFFGMLTGLGADGTFDSGMFNNAGGTLTTLAHESANGPGPNLGADVYFSTFSEIPVFDSSGKMAFTSKLTGSPVDTPNDEGIFSNVGGTVAVVAREGAGGPGPNLGPNATFHDTSGNTFDPPVLNAVGTMAFKARVTEFGGSTSGVFVHANGTTTPIARTNNGGPGPNLGANVIFGQLGDPVINAADNVAFSCNLFGGEVTSADDAAIFSNTGGSLAVVAREGPAGPGPNLAAGVNFSTFNAPVINAAGEVAFMASLAGSGVDSTNDEGIFTNVGGTLAAVARTGIGGPGPNVGDGVVFSNFLLSVPVFHAAGQVAFVGVITGNGVTAANDQGIWTNIGGTLTKIVREGDLFNVDPGPGVDLRTISNLLLFGNSGGEDGRPWSFNDSGVLTFALSFTDGSAGVFTALVPEPVSAELLALGGLALLGRRKR